MITYRATLDVPASTVLLVSRWLLLHGNAHDRRPWQRAATPYVQAVLVLRWFKEATDLRILARDARVSIATAYRYLHEGIDVIAAHAPDLPDVLAKGLAEGWAFVCLDGTLIPSTRSSAPSAAGHDVWYAGKHKRHGGNIQVLTGPTGYPEWVSDVEPGSTHDITAARAPCAARPESRCPRAADADRQGLRQCRDRHPRPVQGAATSMPTTGPVTPMISALRAPSERANALLKRTWKALERVTSVAHRRHRRGGARATAPSTGPGTREAVPVLAEPAVEHRVERAVSLRDPKLVAIELPGGSDSGEVGETCDGKVPVSGS
jgi:hypothetical protein